jgi:hypothetical protein
MLAARRGLALSVLRIAGIADCALCRESQADMPREPRCVAHEHLRGLAFVDTEGDPGSPWEPLPDVSTAAVSHDLTCDVRPLGIRGGKPQAGLDGD